MNETIEAKKPPEVKPWARRVVEAEGVFMPANADWERRVAAVKSEIGGGAAQSE